ncbi:MAG: MarR family transcriptional regulator [Steroidobacteraceae bacterium]|jgi:DNA-binding MarR family transcriptional regulator|nr:MarR family transcriptional regulator [Steroidobacteraceae bacterium]
MSRVLRNPAPALPDPPATPSAPGSRPPSAAEWLDSSACFQLKRAQSRLTHDFAARFHDRGVTSPQLTLLLLIAAHPGISQSALAHAVGIERSTLGEFVDRFEHQELVERRASTEDRRSHALHLTPHGRELLDELMPEAILHEAQVLAPLSQVERRTLFDLLARIANAPGGGVP